MEVDNAAIYSDTSSERSSVSSKHGMKRALLETVDDISQHYETLALIFVRYIQACSLPLCGRNHCQRFLRVVGLVKQVLPIISEIFHQLISEDVADAIVQDIEVYLQRAHPECVGEEALPMQNPTEKVSLIKENFEHLKERNPRIGALYTRLGAHLVELIKHFHHIAIQNHEAIGGHVQKTGSLLRDVLMAELETGDTEPQPCLRFGLLWNTLMVYLHRAYGYSAYCDEFSNLCYDNEDTAIRHP